ncbi:MAG: lipid-A-disaccharide synthase-related protein [Pleurocapsa sp. MO_226.B13]|nr:lipid-A-disaccharide synthase-related protein [Pleurocapsa sp. MO_226.B13]
MKLLVLSNGHGEDKIAVRIIEQLQLVTKIELAALPIVGQGYFYHKLKIPLAGRVQQMPSGGFIYKGGNPLWQDVKGGLIQLTLEQIRIVRQWGKSGGVILAVGDIVPLFYAWLSKSNYAFVGTAKSEYYLRDETGWLAQTSWLEKKFGSVYLPWERWLMSRDACQGVFPRDSLTTKILQQWSIPAYDLGNPMMDGLDRKVEEGETKAEIENVLNILLLPGSRMPEALRNWQQILTSVLDSIKTINSKQLKFLAAIAPALELKPFIQYALTQGWQTTTESTQTVTLTQVNTSLILSQANYGQFLQQANLAIAMAGTATEQFIGLGKPAIIMPGEGPQFTYAFAEAQSRLLGCSIIMVENGDRVGKAILELINNPQQLQQIALNGQRRMGESGAAQRIAQCLQKTLLRDKA